MEAVEERHWHEVSLRWIKVSVHRVSNAKRAGVKVNPESGQVPVSVANQDVDGSCSGKGDIVMKDSV